MNDLLDEQPFSLMVNGRPYATVMMLPDFLREFAVGYLLSENIAKPEDIESIMTDENEISVLTKTPLKVLTPKKTVISGCGGTASYLDPETLPKVHYRAETGNVPKPDFTSPVTSAGGFGCALLTRAGTYFTIYDLSQVSALDKIIGYAILHGISIDETIVALSGKVTADIVRKCLFAGIAVLYAGYPPTKPALAIAMENGLKIIRD